MKIAVTGALGRIGRGIVELATTEGHTVVAIDRTAGDRTADRADGTGVLHVDLTDYEATATALSGCDAVVHLAAIAGPGRLPDHVVHDNNVTASYHVLRAAADIGIGRVCQASSVNAIGGHFSRRPRYDYFPIDEHHPAYPEDPYSLSKWICEQQADAIARLYPDTSIASLRFHGVVTSRADAMASRVLAGPGVEKHLWGYVNRDAVSRACIAGVTADFDGHEVCYVVAPQTMSDTPTAELAAEHYPDVPIRRDLPGTASFFDCTKARELLGWRHDVE